MKKSRKNLVEVDERSIRGAILMTGIVLFIGLALGAEGAWLASLIVLTGLAMVLLIAYIIGRLARDQSKEFKKLRPIRRTFLVLASLLEIMGNIGMIR